MLLDGDVMSQLAVLKGGNILTDYYKFQLCFIGFRYKYFDFIASPDDTANLNLDARRILAN